MVRCKVCDRKRNYGNHDIQMQVEWFVCVMVLNDRALSGLNWLFVIDKNYRY